MDQRLVDKLTQDPGMPLRLYIASPLARKLRRNISRSADGIGNLKSGSVKSARAVSGRTNSTPVDRQGPSLNFDAIIARSPGVADFTHVSTWSGRRYTAFVTGHLRPSDPGLVSGHDGDQPTRLRRPRDRHRGMGRLVQPQPTVRVLRQTPHPSRSRGRTPFAWLVRTP